jgi:N-acetylneuraminic acid mutarotase
MLSNIKRRLSLELIQKALKKNKINDEENNLFNDNHECLSQNNKWYKLKVSGNIPCKRSGHNTVIVDNKVYLFGGCSLDNFNNEFIDNDLCIFNLDTHEWVLLLQKNNPFNRATYGMCATNYNSFIISGGVQSNNTMHPDLYEYSICSNKWEKINDNIINNIYGHSVNKFNNIYLIFGGTTGTEYNNKLYSYNLNTNEYNEIFTTGEIPSKRYKHQAIIIDIFLYIIGGGDFKPNTLLIEIYCLNLKTLVWSKITTEGDIPNAVVAHTCSYDSYDKLIYLYGGFDSNLKRIDKFYSFDICTNTWKNICFEKNTDTPCDIAFSTSIFYKGAFYMFYGANGKYRYDTIWKYQLRNNIPSLAILCAKNIKKNSEIKLDDLHNLPDEICDLLINTNKYATN